MEASVSDKAKDTKESLIRWTRDVSAWQVLAWFVLTVVFGYYAQDKWHDSEEAECYTGTPGANGVIARSDDCFETITTPRTWMYLSVGVVLTLHAIYSYSTGEQISGFVDNGLMMMWGRDDAGNTVTLSSMPRSKQGTIRRAAEIMHAFFAFVSLILWYYAFDNNDQDAIRVTNNLPGIRHIFFLWILVVPLVASEFTRREFGEVIDVPGNCIVSMMVKLFVYVTMVLFIDPHSTLFWDNETDKEVVCYIITAICALAVAMVWKSYIARVEERNKDEYFVYNDFPAYLTLTLAFTWNLKARLTETRPYYGTAPYDVVIYTFYLWVAFLGIWNTPSIGHFTDAYESTRSNMSGQNLIQSATKMKKSNTSDAKFGNL